MVLTFRKSLLITLFAAGTLLASVANAFKVPALQGPVMDEVGILRPAAQQQIASDLFQFKKDTGVQIQVYITKSLQDESIEGVAIQIFDQWKLGSAEKDHGILFLIAPNERRLRIEVGQGLEGSVPDVIAKRIIADVVTPSFRRGNFAEGIISGVSALQSYIVTGEEGNLTPAAQQGKIPASYLLFGFLGIFGIIFLFSPALAFHILLSLLSGGRGGGGYGGGGGGWSGGGGRSSGGGASGGW